jgi:PleD family two-component response regulator
VTHRAPLIHHRANRCGKECLDGFSFRTQTGLVELPTPGFVRILLVEDHETVRQGLRLLIDREADLKVVGEASDGAEAIARGRFDDLDVVVMDLSMPGMSGLVATRTLKSLRPELPAERHIGAYRG